MWCIFLCEDVEILLSQSFIYMTTTIRFSDTEMFDIQISEWAFFLISSLHFMGQKSNIPESRAVQTATVSQQSTFSWTFVDSEFKLYCRDTTLSSAWTNIHVFSLLSVTVLTLQAKASVHKSVLFKYKIHSASTWPGMETSASSTPFVVLS